MRIVCLAFAAFFGLLVSQSSHAGKMEKTNEPIVASADKATIVFMRPGKFVGAAVAVPVFKVLDQDVEFLGIIDSGSKFAYTVPAGEHIFATTVFGGPAGVRFYKAQVEAGKIYYFRARIIEGIWGLEPLRGSFLNTQEFEKLDRATDVTVNSEKTLAWGKDNGKNVTERVRQLQPASIETENTLKVEDGR